MAEGIRTPNIPAGTDLGEFIGHEIIGSTRSVRRFTRASVIGPIEAAVNSFSVGGGVIFSTLSQAQANLNYAANHMAWVIQDATPANNGIYQKQGASGSGSWSRLGDLPYSFYRAVNEGAGTPNAIKATNGYPMANKDALIVVNITATTTATPVTLSLNGGAPLTIKTAAGNDIAPGGLTAGMMVAGYINGDKFRLLSDQASSAIQAAAEAAQKKAEDARDVATGSMSTFLATVFDLKATALAYSPKEAPNYIRLEGHTIQGEGGALYKKVASEPTHPGKFSIKLSDAVTVVWYEISERRLTPLMFGAKRDVAGFDCWQAFSDCIATIGAQAIASSYRYGGPLYIPAGQYEVSKAIPPITTPGVRVIGEGGTTSVIKAQAGITGSYILSHSPPAGDTTTIITGVGVIGVGLDCNEQAIHGYLGEMVYDGVVYDDFRIDRPGASAIGFQLKPRAGNAITVCQTIDIRSLFVGKYTVKGTVPAVLLDNCQEINIWSSKAWNGYGVDNTNKGTAAAWFIQDCRTVTMVGCSAAGSMQAGVQVYANTRSCDGIALINPLFENLSGANVLVDSSNYVNYSVLNFSIINPRHETPVSGYNILALTRGYIEAGPQSVSLGANTKLATVLADDLSQIANSGTNNMLRSRSNQTNSWEGFGHDVRVKPGGVTHLLTRAPADSEASILITVNRSGTVTEKVVLEGPPDSGGTGFRALRTSN